MCSARSPHFARTRGKGEDFMHTRSALAALAIALMPLAAQAEAPVKLPAPAAEAPAQGELETAVIAGGCFWGVQAVFQHLKGVKNAVSGYAGGAQKDAVYDRVSYGSTGH